MRAFRVAYDGTGYYGFQRQPDVPTVEGTVFDALRELGVLEPEAAKPAGYAAAGRTDAGVSALAQTVAFEAPDWLSPRALNAELPADVQAWASADAPTDFHATHGATERTYVYHLYAPAAGARELAANDGDPPVEDGRVADACDALAGTHDYADLTPDDRNTRRTVALDAERDGDFLVLTVRAGGFPRQLVRRLVSLVRAVGADEVPLQRIDRTLAPEPLPDHERAAPAPSEPLVLADVTYPDIEFSIDEEAAASARAVFERRRVERLAGARVSRQLRDGIR
ncbi:tRNA pseudouridine(38-40) synthase TruA [Halovivax sp.]|uniref:tRNA pseudouridine(38-40) synthase TruA n=1 Tax=Halovivax sp. TaxID=1935978 RepID=UPI0025BA2C5F|nr:tRNA pseudouridine(38-40) synthase TruA [Halovivax sp.]